MRDFKTLAVWQKAHALTLAIYEASRGFPREETYGLTSQMRRSASSIPANIAEGCGHESQSELARFLHIAMASASELEYHLLLARDLGILASPAYFQLDQQTGDVKRMLTRFMQKVQADSRSMSRTRVESKLPSATIADEQRSR